MLLLFFALASVTSAGKFPCEEPVTDYRLPSVCPVGQVLHKNICRSYFQLRSERKNYLLSEYLVETRVVPTNEIICPLRAKISNCVLYRAKTSDCLDTSIDKLPPCKEYDAQGEYDLRKMCTQLTAGIPLSGFYIKDRLRPVQVLPAIVPSQPRGRCPPGYCPTNSGFCIRSGKITLSGNGGMAVIFHPVDRPTMFFHGQHANLTEAPNFRDFLHNSQKVPGIRSRREP